MSDKAHHVFTAIVDLSEIDSAEAKDLQSEIQNAVYDLLDEAGVGYKSILLRVVNADEALDDYLKEHGGPGADAIGGFRDGDLDTSRKGAVDAYPRSGNHRHKILIAIAKSGDQGMTYEEVEETTGIKNAHKRISELSQGDWVQSAGERMAKKTGSMSNIWVITNRAERWIETKERAGVLE